MKTNTTHYLDNTNGTVWECLAYRLGSRFKWTRTETNVVGQITFHGIAATLLGAIFESEL